MGFISRLLQELGSVSNQTANENKSIPKKDNKDSHKDDRIIDRDMAQKLSGNVIIPDCMDKIQYKLFDGNKRITSVTVPGTVKEIGVRAFADCENLEQVTY